MRTPEHRILHLLISGGLMVAGIIALLGLIGPESPEPPGALAAPLAQNNAPDTDLCKRAGALPTGATATFHVEGLINNGFQQRDPQITVGSNPCSPSDFENIGASFDPGTTVTITETAPAGFSIAGCSVTRQGNGLNPTSTPLPCSVTNGALTYQVPNVTGGGSIRVEVINSGPPPTATPPPVIADLQLLKATTRQAVIVGQDFSYRLLVGNNGPSAATDVRVLDDLPAGVRFVSVTATQGACSGDATAGIVTCNLGTLPSGQGAKIEIVVTATAAGTQVNQAIVQANETDPNLANNGASASTDVGPLADLALTKTQSTSSLLVGQQLTYTLTARNNGPSAATNVTLVDTLPAGVSLVSVTPSQGSCSGTSTVTCALGGLASGASATVTIVVQATATGTLSNLATVAAQEPDPDPTNNGATTGATVGTPPAPGQPIANLAVAKTASSGSVVVGEDFTYQIVVTNHGPDAATGVTLTEALPPAVTVVSVTPSQGSCSGTRPIICNLGSLANGATARVTVVVSTTQPGTYANAASVTATEFDPDPTDNATTASATAGVLADLAITKLGSPEPVAAGSILTYTLTVRNNGPSDASNVVVEDPLPGGVTPVSVQPSQGTCTGATTIVCNLGILRNGAAATVRIEVRAEAANVLLNQARVTGAELDPNGANNSATEGTLVVGPGVPTMTPTPIAAAANPNNDDEKDPRRRLTEEQQQQRERTNRAGLDEYRTEGNVVGVRCELATPTPSLTTGFLAAPDDVPYAIIATRDGNQTVRLQHEASTTCHSIEIGDYLEADGAKVHEQLFDADSVTIHRDGRRIR